MEPMMVKRIFAGTASLIVALTIALPLAVFAADDSGDFVRLVAPLDEPEFYCFDLAGWGKNLRLDDPLQTHTCKARGMGADPCSGYEAL